MATKYSQHATGEAQSAAREEKGGGSNTTTYIIIGVIVFIVIIVLLIIGGVLIWYFFFKGDGDCPECPPGETDCADCPFDPTQCPKLDCADCPLDPTQCPKLDCADCPFDPTQCPNIDCGVINVPSIPFIFLDPGSYNVAGSFDQKFYDPQNDYCRSREISQALPVTIENKSDKDINVYFSGVRDGPISVCQDMADGPGNFLDEIEGYTYIGTYTSVPPRSGKVSFNLFDGIRFMMGTGSADSPKWVDSVNINGDSISTKGVTNFPGNVPFVQIFSSDVASTPSIVISSDGKKATITYATK